MSLLASCSVAFAAVVIRYLFDKFNATGLHIENILDLKSYSLTEEQKNPLKCTSIPLKRNLGI